MPLPNAENAFIDTRKLTDYCLNLEHFEGRHKARVFKSALNIELCNVDKLQAAAGAGLKPAQAPQKPSRLFLLNAIHKVKNMSLTL